MKLANAERRLQFIESDNKLGMQQREPCPNVFLPDPQSFRTAKVVHELTEPLGTKKCRECLT